MRGQWREIKEGSSGKVRPTEVCLFALLLAKHRETLSEHFQGLEVKLGDDTSRSETEPDRKSSHLPLNYKHIISSLRRTYNIYLSIK